MGLFREEVDPVIISNLKRKGWTELLIPEFDSSKEKLWFNEETHCFAVVSLTENESSLIEENKSQQNFDAQIKNGYKTEEGFILALEDNDRSLFTQMLSLIKEALDLGLITNDTEQTIRDKSGNVQILSTLRFRQVMVGYGMYYKSLWDQMA